MSACAAKLERTGFVFRSVWPNVKHFANEQSASFAQSANESGFVRKNSQKVEAGASRCSRPSNVFTRGARAAGQQPRLRLGSRQLAQGFLNGTLQEPRARHISAGSCAEPKPLQPSLAALLPERHQPAQGPVLHEVAIPRGEQRSRGGISIEELIQTASEKYELNKDFWGKYTDIPSMAQASDKHDILQIIENFVLIHRKHVYLFQRLKNTILKNLDHWSAPDFAALCHAWAQLGFLHEDLCVAMAGRVAATAHACNAQELCWLMDAYATARCSVQSVTAELTKQTLVKLEDFTPSQLCLHASSFARLNLQHSLLFDCIAERLEAVLVHRVTGTATPGSEDEDAFGIPSEALSARDLTLAAYSFAKLGFHSPRIFKAIATGSLAVIRDFTARDLQMLMVALVRAQHHDPELLDALSLQAQRRVAQFSAESLTLTLRSLAFFGRRDSPLFTRAVVQLPRTILHFRPADVTTLLNAFATVQVHSVALFDIVTPFIMEKAPMFTPADWLSALRGYSLLGHRDTSFLSVLRLHLAASKLTMNQLCVAMVDCSRLSFSGLSAALAEAVAAKVDPEGLALPVDTAAQMYSALLLLGHSAGAAVAGDRVRGFLADLAVHLRARVGAGQLSLASCVSLCYATMLAPPVRCAGDGGAVVAEAKHPMDASVLLDRCLGQALALSGEDRVMLQLVERALRLLPWNRRALESARKLEPLAAAGMALAPGGAADPPAPFFRAALSHLAPHLTAGPWPGEPARHSLAGSAAAGPGPGSGPAALQGVFVAREIRDALADISSILSARQIRHNLVLEFNTEAHISIPRGALPPLLASASGAAVAAGGAGRAAAVAIDSVPRRPAPGGQPQGEVAVLWGSTVHYIHGSEEKTAAEAEPMLSPAAGFQVSLLRVQRGADVVVVPHWRWPRSGRPEVCAGLLADLVLESTGG